jgi:galactosamine-6-phosphate isomerase
MAIELKIYNTKEEASESAALSMVVALEEKSDLTLCLATGNSPTRAYELFTDSVRRRALGVQKLRLLKLDEWGGLAADDPATCEVYLQRYLVAPLRLRGEQLVGFHGNADDLNEECLRIQRHLLAVDRIDVCVLGLGMNGHIGFNEPATELCARAHVAALSDSSLGHSMLKETSSKTSVGLTLGIAEILAAREIILLVFGTEKAEQMKRLIEGGVTTQFPASFLQLHPRVTCLCDRSAVSLLSQEG